MLLATLQVNAVVPDSDVVPTERASSDERRGEARNTHAQPIAV